MSRDFPEQLEELNEGMETMNTDARLLEERITENVSRLLDVKG